MFELLYVVVALACASAVPLGLRAFNLPSTSMEPSLHVGSTVLAHRCAYGLSRYSFDGFELPIAGRWPALGPARGDIIVFRLGRTPSTFHIKRVMGLPGDRIQLVAGRPYINGKAAEHEFVGTAKINSGATRAVDAKIYRETLPGGASYTVMQLEGDTGPFSNTAVYEVPPGAYFVMGDNRDNSLDSRVPPQDGGFGYVPIAGIFGPVLVPLRVEPAGVGNSAK